MPKEIKRLRDEKPKPILSRGEMKFPRVDLSPGLFSPEGMVMIFAALFLDLIGFALVIFALDDFFITDIAGLAIIGSWMLFKVGHITTARKTRKMGKKIGKKVFKRLGLSFLIEIIPWIGGLVPAWTLAVYFELKNNPS